MKALTLYQPWATLVALGAKRIETRSWTTKYRGPLAIHVSKRKNIDDLMCFHEPFASALEGTLVHISEGTLLGKLGLGGSIIYKMLPENYHLGCVIATCELIDCRPVYFFNNEPPRDDQKFGSCWHKFQGIIWPIDTKERAFGDYSSGRFLWFLNNVKLLPEPIPARGAMGLWEWKESI